MPKRRIVGLSAICIVMVTIFAIVPLVYYLKYGKTFYSLPSWNLEKPLIPQIPVAVTIGPDNIVSSGRIPELPEDQKSDIVLGLQKVFYAYTSNLIHHFRYITIVSILDADRPAEILLIFSNDIPRVSIFASTTGVIRKISWEGQRITFDPFRLLWFIAVDGDIISDMPGFLIVKTFNSKSLEPRQVQPLDKIPEPPTKILYIHPRFL